MDSRRAIFLAIAIVLGIVAIVPIHKYIAEQQRKLRELEAQGRAVRVIVAAVDIPREQEITDEMIKTAIISKGSFQPGDLDDPASVVGKLAEVDILAGQHINSNMVRSLWTHKFLSQAVPVGMRAITIPVDKISAIEGLVKPGDRVDIIGSFDIPQPAGQTVPVVITVFQGVQVLATNRNISTLRASQGVGTITLALKPEDVKNLTYILDWGRIRLVLRRPLDDSLEQGYEAVTFDTLMRRLGMWQETPPARKTYTVEIIKGTEAEEATIYP